MMQAVDAGSQIGPYTLIARLGAGAMGEVWRARDERLDRHVAIKLLPPDLLGDPDRRARMLREARAAAAVPHPHVVTLFDVVSVDATDVLVMELVEGRTLSELLRAEGPPAVREGLAWMIALADALASAHASGILHRDIKAANVMITPARSLKVLDFGLAKLRDDPNTISPRRPVTTGERSAIALDATMESETGTTAPTGLREGSDAYETRAGSLMGTPMYMAPEQLGGASPDERSEVFSVGVVAWEILAGKPPYTARTMDQLFQQIVEAPLPAWRDGVPAPLRAVLERALAKDPEARWPSMAALRDALVDAQHALFTPKRRRWPLILALIGGALAATAATWLLVRPGHHADGPGDAKVRRALEEYDVFQNDPARSSLRGALAVAPEHPRALAYLILFGGARADELEATATTAERLAAAAPARSKTRALLDAAVALHRRGPALARRALLDAGAGSDRELEVWAAELAYRGGDYDAARAGFAALVDAPEASFRGRIYDHYSSVLIYADQPDEAVRVGALYHAKFPGDADGAAVHATTLALAGRLDEARTFAEQARALAEGEDTLAGLGKVAALAGDLPGAIELYRQAVERAPEKRRPIRRAALGLLLWASGDDAAARVAIAPCMPLGADATSAYRGQCLFVAGVVDRAMAPAAISQLDALAAASSALAPAYGDPAQLAGLLRARASFDGGGCLRPATAPLAPPDRAALEPAYAAPPDFYAVYHLPLFASWATCERAALAAFAGAPDEALALLAPIAERAPGRWWLLDDLERLRAAARP